MHKFVVQKLHFLTYEEQYMKPITENTRSRTERQAHVSGQKMIYINEKVSTACSTEVNLMIKYFNLQLTKSERAREGDLVRLEVKHYT